MDKLTEDEFVIEFFNDPNIQISRLWVLSEMSVDDFTFTMDELITSAKRLNIDERLVRLFRRRFTEFYDKKEEYRQAMYNNGLISDFKEIFTDDDAQRKFIKKISTITDACKIDEFEQVYMEMINACDISYSDLQNISIRYNNYILNGCKFD
jgi:hypothetical protein